MNHYVSVTFHHYSNKFAHFNLSLAEISENFNAFSNFGRTLTETIQLLTDAINCRITSGFQHGG